MDKACKNIKGMEERQSNGGAQASRNLRGSYQEEIPQIRSSCESNPQNKMTNKSDFENQNQFQQVLQKFQLKMEDIMLIMQGFQSKQSIDNDLEILNSNNFERDIKQGSSNNNSNSNDTIKDTLNKKQEGQQQCNEVSQQFQKDLSKVIIDKKKDNAGEDMPLQLRNDYNQNEAYQQKQYQYSYGQNNFMDYKSFQDHNSQNNKNLTTEKDSFFIEEQIEQDKVKRCLDYRQQLDSVNTLSQRQSIANSSANWSVEETDNNLNNYIVNSQQISRNNSNQSNYQDLNQNIKVSMNQNPKEQNNSKMNNNNNINYSFSSQQSVKNNNSINQNQQGIQKNSQNVLKEGEKIANSNYQDDKSIRSSKQHNNSQSCYNKPPHSNTYQCENTNENQVANTFLKGNGNYYIQESANHCSNQDNALPQQWSRSISLQEEITCPIRLLEDGFAVLSINNGINNFIDFESKPISSIYSNINQLNNVNSNNDEFLKAESDTNTLGLAMETELFLSQSEQISLKGLTSNQSVQVLTRKSNDDEQRYSNSRTMNSNPQNIIKWTRQPDELIEQGENENYNEILFQNQNQQPFCSYNSNTIQSYQNNSINKNIPNIKIQDNNFLSSKQTSKSQSTLNGSREPLYTQERSDINNDFDYNYSKSNNKISIQQNKKQLTNNIGLKTIQTEEDDNGQHQDEYNHDYGIQKEHKNIENYNFNSNANFNQHDQKLIEEQIKDQQNQQQQQYNSLCYPSFSEEPQQQIKIKLEREDEEESQQEEENDYYPQDHEDIHEIDLEFQSENIFNEMKRCHKVSLGTIPKSVDCSTMKNLQQECWNQHHHQQQQCDLCEVFSLDNRGNRVSQRSGEPQDHLDIEIQDNHFQVNQKGNNGNFCSKQQWDKHPNDKRKNYIVNQQNEALLDKYEAENKRLQFENSLLKQEISELNGKLSGIQESKRDFELIVNSLKQNLEWVTSLLKKKEDDYSTLFEKYNGMVEKMQLLELQRVSLSPSLRHRESFKDFSKREQEVPKNSISEKENSRQYIPNSVNNSNSLNKSSGRYQQNISDGKSINTESKSSVQMGILQESSNITQLRPPIMKQQRKIVNYDELSQSRNKDSAFFNNSNGSEIINRGIMSTASSSQKNLLSFNSQENSEQSRNQKKLSTSPSRSRGNDSIKNYNKFSQSIPNSASSRNSTEERMSAATSRHLDSLKTQNYQQNLSPSPNQYLFPKQRDCNSREGENTLPLSSKASILSSSCQIVQSQGQRGYTEQFKKQKNYHASQSSSGQDVKQSIEELRNFCLRKK